MSDSLSDDDLRAPELFEVIPHRTDIHLSFSLKQWIGHARGTYSYQISTKIF